MKENVKKTISFLILRIRRTLKVVLIRKFQKFVKKLRVKITANLLSDFFFFLVIIVVLSRLNFFKEFTREYHDSNESNFFVFTIKFFIFYIFSFFVNCVQAVESFFLSSPFLIMVERVFYVSCFCFVFLIYLRRLNCLFKGIDISKKKPLSWSRLLKLYLFSVLCSCLFFADDLFLCLKHYTSIDIDAIWFVLICLLVVFFIPDKK